MSATTVPYLQGDRLVEELERRPGLIPIHLNAERYQLTWCDIGDHQLTEAFFATFVGKVARQQHKGQLFISDLDPLGTLHGVVDCLYPRGFIFHMGRCGSTLLSRALALSPHHVVLSEAQPHNMIWWHWTQNWLRAPECSGRELEAYRNLLLLMGRRRTAHQDAHFIKFSTWNALLIQAIKMAFPDVPCLFVYREPAEVMVSFLDHPPGWLMMKDTAFGAFIVGSPVDEAGAMSDIEFCEKFLANLMRSAVTAPFRDLAYVSYERLTSENFEWVLSRAFSYTVGPDQVRLMRKQFCYYSKDESSSQVFVSDRVKKHEAVTPEIRGYVEGALSGLCRELERSERNLVR